MSNSSTFVLVHGAWCGGWFWDRVTPHLVKRGHTVFAPTLTGLAERSHVLQCEATLDTHIEDVCRIIRFFELNKVTLVGHSYGGLVISGVAQALDDMQIGSIVFLDALMAPFPTLEDAPDLPISEDDVVDGLIPPISPSAFGHEGEDAALLEKRWTPMSANTLFQPIGECPKVEQVARKTFILADDPAVPIIQHFYDKKKSDSSWRTAVIHSGHNTMIDEPERTADLLHEAAS